MGYDIHTHHKLANLIKKSKFVLTNQRLQTYTRVLQYPDVTVKSCTTANPVDLVPLPHEGEPHDCEAEVKAFVKMRSDLSASPSPLAQLTFFVDGSCY